MYAFQVKIPAFLLHVVSLCKGAFSLSLDIRASPISPVVSCTLLCITFCPLFLQFTSEVRVMTINNDGNALTAEDI